MSGTACNRRRKCLTLLGLALISLPSAADVIAPEAFGMHFHAMVNGDRWPEGATFGYLRLWDAGVLWRHLESEKGRWNFDLLDRYVDEAHKRGVKVLLTLGQTPQWAALRPGAPSPYGPGASSAPRSLEDWRNYVSTLAIRYKGRIHAWELWNEVNVKHFWSGDFTMLAVMEQAAAEAIKRIDPDSVVLTASVQGGAFRELDAYFKAGGGRHADAVSYHFYAPTEEAEALAERIRRVREIMTKHGLGAKPLWNTEFGWLIPNSDGSFGAKERPAWRKWRKLGRLEAAGFVLRAHLHAFNGGIRHNFWYAWDNGAMGLAEDRGKTPKPAAVGYVRAREWLIGARFEGCTSDSGMWRCQLRRDGKQQWIVWSDGERAFTPPAAWNVRMAQGLFETAPAPLQPPVALSPLPTLLSQ